MRKLKVIGDLTVSREAEGVYALEITVKDRQGGWTGKLRVYGDQVEALHRDMSPTEADNERLECKHCRSTQLDPPRASVHGVDQKCVVCGQ